MKPPDRQQTLPDPRTEPSPAPTETHEPRTTVQPRPNLDDHGPGQADRSPAESRDGYPPPRPNQPPPAAGRNPTSWTTTPAPRHARRPRDSPACAVDRRSKRAGQPDQNPAYDHRAPAP